jgi:hypothetical protein
MTREEELDWLYRLRNEIYVYMPKEWLTPMNNALNMAMKELEQEPVLDKIRAEIEKVFCMSVVTNELRTPMEVKTEILQIIDKYRGSEGADADRE